MLKIKKDMLLFDDGIKERLDFIIKYLNKEAVFENGSVVSIPALTQFTFDNVTKMTKHSHSILYKSKEYDKVIKIVKKIYSEFKNGMLNDHDFELFYDNHINEYQMWQLGITSGIRLIGIRYNNIFSVLFIDYHHLIYPDKNYNQDNYELYSFCPIENNN